MLDLKVVLDHVSDIHWLHGPLALDFAEASFRAHASWRGAVNPGRSNRAVLIVSYGRFIDILQCRFPFTNQTTL